MTTTNQSQPFLTDVKELRRRAREQIEKGAIVMRSASQYGSQDLDLVGMIKENLIAERIAIEHYRELIHFFGEKDSTTRVMLEEILAVEEEHANDMSDLLSAHGGK